MTSEMEHRGPDDEGVYASDSVVLAHRRLSILDLSSNGHQPMSNADADVHIVFNGEIYNYKELKDRVSHYSFRSNTDTEVLLHLYQEYGTDCLSMLRGMFAFAIWDERKERLFLARDRLGQKPLFYRHSDDAFWFGSTIKTLLADDEITPEPDLPAIRSYLSYQYVPNPATGFEGIGQVSPGEYLVVSEDGVTKSRYWDLTFGEKFDASPGRIADRLRSRLREATKLRMRSDVPVGAFLSGGIDSSVVVSLMDRVADDPIKTYSIGFDEDSYDELDFARSVAERFGTDHHEYTVTPDSADLLPELVEHYEMPFGDPSALPTYYVAQAASQDVKVALTGDAGDENFAGYSRYWYDRVVSTATRIPKPMRSSAVQAFEALPDAIGNQKQVHRAKRTLEVADLDDAERYGMFVCRDTDDNPDDVWNGSASSADLAELREQFERADGPTRLDEVMEVDINTYLPDDLLVKVDRASMAHSLEVRSPFLDHELMEFSARIPSKYKRRRGESKWILKKAFRDYLPDEVIDRSKQGFAVPVQEWFRGELRGLAERKFESLENRPPFDAEGVSQLYDEHLSGEADHGYRLWDLLMLESWYERFIDQPR